MEKILNKRKIRGTEKYLVWWKEFTVEYDTWEKKEDLENIREALKEFEGKMEAEVRRQEKLDIVEERDFRREELPERFIAKILYRWDDGKFEEKYLKKLERNWWKWKSVSLEEKPWKEVMSRLWEVNLAVYYFLLLLFLFSFNLCPDFLFIELRVRVDQS